MPVLSDELYQFAEEDSLLPSASTKWKIVVIDRESTNQTFYQTLFNQFYFDQKEVSQLYHDSIAKAQECILARTDIAMIIIDCDKEQANDVIHFIRCIRDEFKIQYLKIMLANVPYDDNQIEEILNHDIDGILKKSDSTQVYLRKNLLIHLRAYQNLLELENSRKSLRDIVAATNRFVPNMFLEILNKQSIVDINLTDYVEKKLTILFLDIRSFTSFSEFSTPRETFQLVNDCMSYLEPCIAQNNGFIDKHIGDAILAIFPNEPDDAVKAATMLLKNLSQYNYARIMKKQIPIKIGIGINTGSVVLGVVGFKDRTDCTVIGDAVNVTARVEKCNKIFSTNLMVSKQAYHQLKNTNQFMHRFLGKVQVPGKKQLLEVYEFFDADSEKIVAFKQDTKPIFEEAVQLFIEGNYSAANQLFQVLYDKNPFDNAVKHYLSICSDTLKS